jgi:hypothetical protein
MGSPRQKTGTGNKKMSKVIRKADVNKLCASCPCQGWDIFSYLFVTCHALGCSGFKS